ncbi:hypothetical protein ACFPRL_31095 [Pseudoclavibacter helvolus]
MGAYCDATDREGRDRDPLPGEEDGGEDLACQLRHPVEVDEVVDDADQNDEGRRSDKGPDSTRLLEHEREERNLGGGGKRQQHPDEHGDATEPGLGGRVHVPVADWWVPLVPHRESPDTVDQQERDERRAYYEGEVDPHARTRAPPVTGAATAVRRRRSRPGSRRRPLGRRLSLRPRWPRCRLVREQSLRRIRAA